MSIYQLFHLISLSFDLFSITSDSNSATLKTASNRLFAQVEGIQLIDRKKRSCFSKCILGDFHDFKIFAKMLYPKVKFK